MLRHANASRSAATHVRVVPEGQRAWLAGADVWFDLAVSWSSRSTRDRTNKGGSDGTARRVCVRGLALPPRHVTSGGSQYQEDLDRPRQTDADSAEKNEEHRDEFVER